MASVSTIDFSRSLSLTAGGRVLLLLVLLSCAGGCETVRFYSQAARGQLELLLSREPVTRLLERDDLAEPLRQELVRSQQLLAYLEQALGLKVGKRYRSYVALKRDAVVYNLITTPPFSVEPHRWCYPLVGCAPYRGYFARQDAEALAERFRRRGYSTYVGAIPAYSTLGWFADPLLSTFSGWPEPALLELLAHELAHGEVWLRGSVAVNEAFATFVGRQAVRNYYDTVADASFQRWVERERAWHLLVSELLALRSVLATLYAQPLDEAVMGARKTAVYLAFRACYERNRVRFGRGRFDQYVASINDAALAVLATYQQQLPAFAALFRRSGEDWPTFFAAVAALNELPEAERARALTAWLPSAHEQKTQSTDDEGTEQVQCEAFARHAINGHLP